MVDFPSPRAESSGSHQMRLLLVKRGSGLPLYLHLVTDYLRLFTLYEQVGRSCAQCAGVFPTAVSLLGLHSACLSVLDCFPLLQ